jgi:hypothetical protein
MPLFEKIDTYEIVWRRYEINAEVLDGKMTLLPNDAKCHIITHHPNKS